MIFLPAFSPDAVLAALPGATVMMGVPTFYTRLLSDPRLTVEACVGVRLFISGSAPLSPATHAEWRARTGHVILERYGMTETNMITSNPYHGLRKAGTVGMPLTDVEVRITGPAGVLPTGEAGAIEVRGPNVFKGYWRMPEKTAEEFREGWFITGDLGAFDAEGYLSILGRAKDLVITGGLNVYPAEVEAALDALPGVRASAVIGVPHPDFGEAVIACVVGAISEEAVRADLRDRLAAFKIPKRVIVMGDLPRNAMGKVQKVELRRLHARLFRRLKALSLSKVVKMTGMAVLRQPGRNEELPERADRSGGPCVDCGTLVSRPGLVWSGARMIYCPQSLHATASLPLRRKPLHQLRARAFGALGAGAVDHVTRLGQIDPAQQALTGPTEAGRIDRERKPMAARASASIGRPASSPQNESGRSGLGAAGDDLFEKAGKDRFSVS
jgi:hypothetical protein